MPEFSFEEKSFAVLDLGSNDLAAFVQLARPRDDVLVRRLLATLTMCVPDLLDSTSEGVGIGNDRYTRVPARVLQTDPYRDALRRGIRGLDVGVPWMDLSRRP